MDTFLKRLQFYMERAELNPRSLSLKAGLNPRFVSDLSEKGVSPSLKNFLKLSRALGVKPYELDPELEAEIPKDILAASEELRRIEEERNIKVRAVMKRFKSRE